MLQCHAAAAVLTCVCICRPRRALRIKKSCELPRISSRECFGPTVALQCSTICWPWPWQRPWVILVDRVPHTLGECTEAGPVHHLAGCMDSALLLMLTWSVQTRWTFDSRMVGQDVCQVPGSQPCTTEPHALPSPRVPCHAHCVVRGHGGGQRRCSWRYT